MADAADLKFDVERREGSNPFSRTISKVKVIGISTKYIYDCTGALIDICPKCIEELKMLLSSADFPLDEDFK